MKESSEKEILKKPAGFLAGPDGDSSSKRLGAMFCLLNAASITYIGIFFIKDFVNVLPMVWTWLTAALTLWGIAAWSKT